MIDVIGIINDNSNILRKSTLKEDKH